MIFAKKRVQNMMKKKSCNNCPIQKAFEKLAEYEDLEEQGKLLKLPCAVGDTVYAIKTVKRKDIIRKEIWDYIVTSFHIERDCDWNVSFEHIEPNGRIFPTQGEFKDFDKTVFLTREEAEAALKELERGKGE